MKQGGGRFFMTSNGKEFVVAEVEKEVVAAPKAAYSIDQFCEAYGIGRSLCYEEISAGRLRVKKVGRRTIVAAADAQAWLDSLPSGQNAA
jgi:hypothetical protein